MKKLASYAGVIILAIFALGGCSSGPDIWDSTDDLFKINPFQLRLGQTIVLPPDDVQVTFAEVLNDSRCPVGVQCFWEGMAEIALLVRPPSGETQQVTVAIYGGGPSVAYQRLISVDTLGYRFMLLKFEPYPVYEQPIPDSLRVATLAVFPFEPFDSIDGEVMVTDASPRSLQEDWFGLDSAVVRGDVLHLALQYSGGCEAHDFELYMAPAAFAESLPVQADLYVYHEDNGDACEALIRRNLQFDLRPIGHVYDLMYDEPAAIRLNIYHYFADTPGEKISVMYNYPQEYWVPEEHH